MNLNNWERKVLLDALDIAYEDEDAPIFNDGDVHAIQSRFSTLKEKLQDETPYVDQLKRIADSLEKLTSGQSINDMHNVLTNMAHEMGMAFQSGMSRTR